MRGIGSGRVQPGGIAPDDQQSAVGANSPAGPSARRVALEKRRWRWDCEATTRLAGADRIGTAKPGEYVEATGQWADDPEFGEQFKADALRILPPSTVEGIEKYLGSDLVFYRAETPAALVESQAQFWDPILGFARDELGACFVTTQGVSCVAQPAAAVAAARRAIPENPWRLGAVHVMTTMTGSVRRPAVTGSTC